MMNMNEELYEINMFIIGLMNKSLLILLSKRNLENKNKNKF
jgi:hypothetical protein